jgi:hypothetical protein
LDGQETSSEAHHHTTVEDEFRQIYFDALDHITTAIKDRFNQPSFKVYANLEELLVHGARNEPFEAGFEQVKKLYPDEIDVSALVSEFHLFQQMFDESPECLDDIMKVFKRRDKKERLLIPNIITTCKLVLVNPATSATPERSFSSGRNIKTWKRSTTKAKRFNALSILYIYKELTDKIDLITIGNEFVGKYDERKNIFGKFSHDDVKR